jgi:hypothetical protein
LTFGRYEIDGLYIKLDKKLILEAENIIIPKSKAKPSFKNVDRTFDNIKYLFTFFDSIELKRVHFNDNVLTVVFVDNILYITSNEYEIAGNIERVGQKLVADVSLLYIKKEDIRIDGKLAYDLKKNRLKTQGRFDAYNIKGSFKAEQEDGHIRFALKSEPFTDLRTIIGKFPLHPVVRSWIVDKIQAERYRLHTLEGRVNIDKNGLSLDVGSLYGKAFLENAKIYYKEGLSPVLTEKLTLSYRKGGLYFDLKEPVYENRDLNGSSVKITGFTGKEPIVLQVDLHIKSPMDRTVQKIFRAYGLQIPVTQERGVARADVNISVPLSDQSRKTSVLVNVELEEGDVYIGNVRLPVTKGNVQYEKGMIVLRDIMLKEQWYEGKVNGKVDVKAKKSKLQFEVKSIEIGKGKEKFFVLKKKMLPVTIDYTKELAVSVPLLGLKVYKTAEQVAIELSDLKKIKPYLQHTGISVEGGDLKLFTKTLQEFSFKGVLKQNDCFFYDNDNACYVLIPYSGTFTSKGLKVYAFDKRLFYDAAKSRVKLTKLNIDLKKFLAAKKRAEKNKMKGIVILGKQSNIRYENHTLVTDSYDIEVKPNGDIKAIGSLDGDIVKFSKTGKIFSMQALRVKDKMLHPLIDFDGLKEGRYSLKKYGDPDKEMKGKIIVEGGVLSDFKAYNNILAFINAIPALAALKSPGFSQKGFKIKEGVVDYRMFKEKIVFDSIYIQGASATFVGKGEIDLKKKSIQMDLAIQTAREFGKLVGNLPLLGYILMGKDKSMTVGLKISGPLKNPKVETSAAEEILALPLQLIKRTIESPAHLMNK